MARTIKLSDLDERLDDLPYPVGNELAATLLEGTTVELAGGEVDLGRVVELSSADRFTSTDDLASEVRSNLPRQAVGEPYQSEGEG